MYLKKKKNVLNSFQKLIKSLCAQNITCDFVIWCLIALLDKVDEDAVQYEDFAGTVSGWLDQICVHSGIGQHEQAVKFFKSTHIGRSFKHA